MVRKLILGTAVVAMLGSCHTKERVQLQAKVDSLQVELQNSKQTADALQEVGVLLDSIDSKRQVLRSGMVEGTTYTSYASRLKSLNEYVATTQTKIAELEKTSKQNRTYSATIKRLKTDLESSTQQIAALQGEVEKMRGENTTLATTVSRRDSAITANTDVIKMRESDISALETKVDQINKESKASQADLYFAQAQALEVAANRTKFAPKKKKETQREALELYKLSLSLGKEEAQNKITELEKELS